MKAVIFDSFGESSVLHLSEVPAPQVNEGEVLIKISHTSVNPVDRKIREGHFKDILPYRFPIIPGWDLAGEIASIGEGVPNFSIGDSVYAYTRLPEIHWGTYAEFIALPASFIALKPKNLSAAHAAGVPLVALTAFQALNEVVKVSKGDKVLITGGAGGVGAYAIQFARNAGAEVTACASTSNLAYLMELGAKHVIDYTKESLKTKGRQISPDGFDVIFDTVGGPTLIESAGLKHSKSRLVSIVENSEFGPFHFVYPNGEQLKQIARQFETGSLQLQATNIRNIKDAAAAQDENAKGHGRGKCVLEISF